jgi:hypothetical protein
MRATPSFTSRTRTDLLGVEVLLEPLDLAEQHVLDLARAELRIDRSHVNPSMLEFEF